MEKEFFDVFPNLKAERSAERMAGHGKSHQSIL